MDIRGFAEALIQRIQAADLSASFVDEKTFESEHLVNAAWELSRAHPEIRVFTHPWRRTTTCKPTCDAAAMEFADRAEGCKVCWKRSKGRSVADVFGTRNNFDLAAIDPNGGSLAVEVKWLSLMANKGPNSEFQRFIGQCALADAANDVVIGVCGLRGRRERLFDRHEEKLKQLLREIGVHLLVLRTESFTFGDVRPAR
ncbi:MAG TPA: hypothetical protein VNJ04_00125 [Gemmatimonadaceae bacterium]|nr:hypothetical protein [Gemmatimonadaceae bacterium]